MQDHIYIKGARENNLKNIDVTIPRDKLVVLTGLSGSGKSSLAFDTIYAEGQRRYVESLSSYARMFLGQMDKPDVDYIDGLSPAISIDQKTTSKNPRSSGTLSGGESQRIRLATQIGSSLMGVLYILDEPSIGLHQRDNDKLLATLCRLRDLGNTLIVVEHDEDTMRAADYLIDIGPGAGAHGGQVVAAGTPEEVMANPNSLTGQYLSGKKRIVVPAARLLHTMA